MNVFGAERIMWASDFTTNQTGETWAELLFALRENTELTEDERAWVLGGSARKLLSIEI